MEETGLSINPNQKIATAPPRAGDAVLLARGASPAIPGYQPVSPASFPRTPATALGQRTPRARAARWGRQRPSSLCSRHRFPARFSCPRQRFRAAQQAGCAGWRRSMSPTLSGTNPLRNANAFERSHPGSRCDIPGGGDLAHGARTSGCACASGHRPARCGERPAASVRRGGAPPDGGTAGTGCAAGRERRRCGARRNAAPQRRGAQGARSGPGRDGSAPRTCPCAKLPLPLRHREARRPDGAADDTRTEDRSLDQSDVRVESCGRPSLADFADAGERVGEGALRYVCPSVGSRLEYGVVSGLGRVPILAITLETTTTSTTSTSNPEQTTSAPTPRTRLRICIGKSRRKPTRSAGPHSKRWKRLSRVESSSRLKCSVKARRRPSSWTTRPRSSS